MTDFKKREIDDKEKNLLFFLKILVTAITHEHILMK